MTNSSPSSPKQVAVIGARGHVGRELLGLLAGHPGFDITLAASRALAGEPLRAHVPGYDGTLLYQAVNPEAVAGLEADVIVLALPNGQSEAFVAAAGQNPARPLLLDLSADRRGQAGWVYGLPELYRKDIRGAIRIANPGCYATAMLLGLWPVRKLMAGPPACFGISGYSGAGSYPSRRNDRAELRGNIQPYGLTGHGHEIEVSRQLGCRVDFTPHVADFFRGLTLTLNLRLKEPISKEALLALYQTQYKQEPLVRLSEDIPEIKSVAGTALARIGGFEVAEDGRRVVIVPVLDNLLKGAASQALQNMNLAVGYEEYAGIPGGFSGGQA